MKTNHSPSSHATNRLIGHDHHVAPPYADASSPEVDHAAMGHSRDPQPARVDMAPGAPDHAAMDHGTQGGHGGMAHDMSANLSPDGTLVAYDVGQPGSRRIEVVASAGGAPQQVQTPSGDASNPVWSGDASQLAVVIANGADQRIWIVGLDGSQTEVPIAPHEKVWCLAWTS